MYNKELIDRNLHPRRYGKIEEVKSIRMINASCGDEIEIFLKVLDGEIIDGKWNGRGCAISTVAADCFVDDVIGCDTQEAKEKGEEFFQMILGGRKVEGESKILESVSRMPARANCAKLAWKSLEKLT